MLRTQFRLALRRPERSMAALCTAMALTLCGCAREQGRAPFEQAERPVRAFVPSGQVIVAWNEIALESAVAADGYTDLFPHLRALTMMHLAMHDAVNGVRQSYATYASHATDPTADATAAAAAAAHAVLTALYPERRAALDQQLEPFGRGLASAVRQSSFQLGELAAGAVREARAGDGSELSGTYKAGGKPGDYQLVPPAMAIYRPDWRFVKPFGLASVEQFRSPPPLALDSAAYAADHEEVRAYGRATGSTRTAEQTAYSDWWYELSELGWNRIARVTWADQRLDLWQSARLFALLNVSMMDGYLAGWDSKLHYDFWRPYTAIRAGDSDGNAGTSAEPSWEPYCVTPPIQEYPSTHSVLGAVGAEVLVALYGGDTAFTVASQSSKPPGQLRSFPTLLDAARENADSRVACGIHFRFSTSAGLELGRQVADYVTATLLAPLHD